MVWITSSRKPFPRICILVSLHYFPLRQTDHRDTGGLSGSGMHQPPTFACRRHTWDCLERERGSHDLEGKLNIAFGSMEGKCNHHHHHLVSWGGGRFKGAAWDHLMRYGIQCHPGCWWQVISEWWWAASPRSSLSVLEQKSGSAGVARVSLRTYKTERCVQSIKRRGFFFAGGA